MTPEESSGTESLKSEIAALLDKLDEESLRFLKQQAEVLLYSGELAAARKKAAEAAHNRKTDEAEGTEQDEGAAEPSKPPVSITRRGDTSFFITVTGTRGFFNRQEMREMTRIAHRAGDAPEGARRLHRWLERERTDFLKDTGIDRPGDPRLGELWSVIVSTYKAG
ncbi:MAG: hypothetical protein ACLFRR_11175 [Spirochaetaceae bacterium]